MSGVKGQKHSKKEFGRNTNNYSGVKAKVKCNKCFNDFNKDEVVSDGYKYVCKRCNKKNE